MRPVVLVTGFGPFLGHAENPSEHLARAIGAIDDLPVRFVALGPLPVVRGEAAATVLEAARALPGHAATLCLGLAAQSPDVRLETQGRNRASAPEPDARGVCGDGGPVVPGAPDTLPCTLPLAVIGDALGRYGVRWSRSDDAGGYVCNDLYLRLLHARASHAGEGPAPAPTVFVHVPKDAHRDPALARALAEGLAAAVSTT